MLAVRVLLTTTVEGARPVTDRLLDEAASMTTRFDGCNRYAVSTDPRDPTRVTLLEEWRDRTTFDAYLASPEFAALGAVLGAHLAGPPDSAYVEGSIVGP